MGLSLRTTAFARIIALALCVALWGAHSAWAQSTTTLQTMLNELMQDHPEIQAVEKEVQATDEALEAAQLLWFPTANLTTSVGYQNRQFPGTNRDTSLTAGRESVVVTQPLLDFGHKSSVISMADIDHSIAKANHRQAQQSLILEAAHVMLDYHRYHQIAELNKALLSNFLIIQGLEKSRLNQGGSSLDQALAIDRQAIILRTRLTQAQGTLLQAINRFERLFATQPKTPKTTPWPQVTRTHIPANLKSAIEHALAHNPQVQVAQLQTRRAEADIEGVRADNLLPDVNLKLTHAADRNHEGIRGTQMENIAEVELVMPINLGGRGFSLLESVRHTHIAELRKLRGRELALEENIKNSWNGYRTALEVHKLSIDQYTVDKKFRDIVVKARENGKRSLLEQLTSEIALTDTKIATIEAITNVQRQALDLLFYMGTLDVSTLSAGQSLRF